PPTPLAASSTRTENPEPRSRCSMYKPAKPAPTTMTSKSTPLARACKAGSAKVCIDRIAHIADVAPHHAFERGVGERHDGEVPQRIGKPRVAPHTAPAERAGRL